MAISVAVAIALALAIYFFTVEAGGPDRSGLARTRVNSYWYDVGHGKWREAYKMMTPGNRQQVTLSNYIQGFVTLLEQTNGIKETTGAIEVNGDFAVATVSLESPRAQGGLFTRYQHLYWDGSDWFISDQAGGLSNTK